MFVAGCLLVGLLSYGGSYLWVYQLKTPAQVDEKSLPEIASLEDKLTSDKLGLRLKEETRKKELKESGIQENPAQHQDISQQIVQLEKQFDIKHKNSQPIENNKSSKLPVAADSESDDFIVTSEQKTGGDISQAADAEPMTEAEQAATENKASGKSDPTDFQDKPESFTRIIYFSESVSKNETSTKISDVQLPSSIKCLEHPEKPPKFYCDICESYFCADCAKTFSESGNYCPFCRLTCKPIEIRVGSDSSPQEKKKTNLLEIGKGSNLIVQDDPDKRNYKLGIIPAFIIAVLFSTSISIFWVYKISPYLETGNQEISQKASPNAVKNQETQDNKTAETLSSNAANNGEKTAANEPCVNPATKEAFECDEQTRQALYEQNRKMKAVESAQKKVAEKSGAIAPSENSSQENEAQTAKQPSAAELAKKEIEKQQFIKTFAVSFVIIFGLLLSTRLFHKEKNSPPD
jgi:hypothetical protein